MAWKLFLDDERLPADSDSNQYTICRNLHDVIVSLHHNGPIQYATFDHDLGPNEPTGMYVVKYLVSEEMDGNNVFTDDFKWYVHSQNPVGKDNINSYLECYFRQKRNGFLSTKDSHSTIS